MAYTRTALTDPVSHCKKYDVSVLGVNVKLTWLVLGEDPAARSHRVEQFTAL